MTVEIRPCRPEEMDEFILNTRTSFLTPPDRPSVGMVPEWTLCAFENGKMATTYAAWPLLVSFNGRNAPMAGVTHVTTRSEYRRRGFLRKITGEHFRLMREKKEQAMAILHAAHAEIYQRYGYGVAATLYRYRIEPGQIRFAFPVPATGRCRAVDDGNYDVLEPVYERFQTGRTGYLRRNKLTWEARILGPAPQGQVKHIVVYQENGEDLGYVVYTAQFERIPDWTEPPHLIWINDFIWLTPGAYQALWNHFASMDLVREVIGSTALDDPLPHLLIEPRMLRAMTWDGLMSRIVDVEQALPLRGYDEEAALVFELTDEMCPWNQGRWKLETSTSEARITGTSAEPDMVMPISTLNMLAFGQISASEAARMGRLEAVRPETLPLWDRVMRTRYRPFCPDNF